MSNLTNLLAFHAANVSFIKFTALMTLPWLAAVTTVYVVFRVFFRRDLSVQPEPQQDEPAPPTPVFALVVVALTLVGFVVAEAAGVAPAWAALAGAAVMAIRGLIRRHTSAVAIVRAANVPFLVFVLALGVVVQAVMRNGVAERMGAVLPSGTGLARVARVRGVGRRAGQRRQQPARHAGAGAAGGIDRAGGGAGRVDRGEHRPELDLCRVAVEPTVAERFTSLRRPGQYRRVHPAWVVHCPDRVGDVGAGAVGRRATTRALRR